MVTTPLTWIPETLPADTLWTSIAYGNGMFVAIGATYADPYRRIFLFATVATSRNGVTWTAHPMVTDSGIYSGNTYTNPFTTVVFGNGVFVAFAGSQLDSYSGDNFYSLDMGNVAAVSSDGVTWTLKPLLGGLDLHPQTWYAVTFGGGVFLAIAAVAWLDQSAWSLTSPDGDNWTQSRMPYLWSGYTYWATVCYGGIPGVFVAFANEHIDRYSSNAVFTTSPDGITWTQRDLPLRAPWIACAHGNNIFLAIADGFTTAGGVSTSPAMTSIDGINWTEHDIILPTSNRFTGWEAVTFGAGLFVVISYGTGDFATSPDGITWTLGTMPAVAPWTAITFGGDIFCAVAEGVVAAITGLPSQVKRYLRMTQRNDGLGIDRHPRLRVAGANNPSSKQATASIRLGDNNTYR